MTLIYNKKENKERRKQLRSSLTYEESVLWNVLRKYFKQQRFRRQYSCSAYILDFYSPRYRIAIELDGVQHLDNSEYDRKRDLFIASFGIKVLRFWNKDVNSNLEGVVFKISEAVVASKG